MSEVKRGDTPRDDDDSSENDEKESDARRSGFVASRRVWIPDDLIDRLSSDLAVVTNESVKAVTAYMPRVRNGNVVRASFNLE